LNTGDLAIVRLRQQLLAAARAIQTGNSSGGIDHAAAGHGRARAFSDVLPAKADWRAFVDSRTETN
jgi:hypothetical protein